VEYGRCIYNCAVPDVNIFSLNNDYSVLPPEVGDWNNIVCGKDKGASVEVVK